MRVGFYLGYIESGEIGGGFTFQSSLINTLSIINTNHEFYFYYRNRFDLFEDKRFVNLNTTTNFQLFKSFFNPKKKRKNTKELKLNDFVKRDKIDFVYFTSPSCEDVHSPYAITVWDLAHRVHPHFPEVSYNGWSFEQREKHYKKYLMKASYIIIGNNTGKKQIQRYYNIDYEKIKTIPMPVPSYLKHTIEDPAILSKYNLEKDKYLFYPAQFWAHKNHIRLLKVMKKLKEKGFKMVFTGHDTGNMEYIKNKCNEFNLENEIIFAGFVTKEELVALYKNAFALTYSSYFGPDNIPPIEAMSLKCPVIAANIEGAEEQMQNCALFFDPKNEIDLINQIKKLENINFKSDLINRAEIFVKQYSLNNYVQNMMNIIDEFEPIKECWD